MHAARGPDRGGFLTLLLFLLLPPCFGAPRLNLGFERLSIQEGLSQSIVACILQDHRGFLWFGTEEGLNRYDGYGFQVYKQVEGNPASLSHGNILSLLESREGEIWVGTFHGGLNRYDPRLDRFTRFPRALPAAGTEGLSNDVVRSVLQDRQGAIWVGTDSGLNRLDPDRKTFRVFHSQPGIAGSLSQDEIYALCEDAEGILWIGTNGGGLNRYDPKSNLFSVFRPEPGAPAGSDSDCIWTLHRARSGHIWVGTKGSRIYRFDPASGAFTPFALQSARFPSPEHFPVYALLEDRDGILWVGTGGNGLIALDPRDGSFSAYRFSPLEANSLSNNEIRSIREDRSGVLWIGTYGGGITKIRKRQFSHIQVDPEDPDRLSNNIVWSLLEDGSGILWIGTHGGGLDRYDRRADRFTHFRHRPGDPTSLSSNIVRLVYEDREGTLWLGTNGGGLNRFDRSRGTFFAYRNRPEDSSSISHDEIRALYEDRNGNFWVGTHGGGLNRLDRRTGRFTRYLPREGDPGSISSNIVRGLLHDQSGVLWVATYGGGLCRLDPGSGRFTAFRAAPEEAGRLNNDFLFALYEDRRRNLWIATWGGGLNRLNPERTTFSHYGVPEGLPSNSIYGMLEDEAGMLWISTLNGLSRLDPETMAVKNYNELDGLQSNEFNGGSYFRSRNGEMFFGGIRGFNFFFPAAIRENEVVPPVVLTSFQKLNKDVALPRPISETGEIVLSHRDYLFSFEFSALDFTAPSKNRYAYRMQGLDVDWIQTPSTRRFASFTSLKPGEYRFQVKGSNNDGIWNSEGASIRIVITPPFWQTWSFTVLLAAGFVGLLGLAFRIRTARLTDRLETKRLENELKLKADFTAMLVHELRTPLTAVMGYADALRIFPERMSVKKTCDVIVQSSEKMLTLINDMLDYSKFEAGKMVLNKAEITLAPLISEALELLAPLFQQKEIQVRCEIQPEAQSARILADSDKITQVINNLLSNAVKFTPAGGNVRIAVRKIRPEVLEVMVEDDGEGIEEEYRPLLFDQYAQLSAPRKVKGTGLGLAVSRFIIEAHGGAIGHRHSPSGRGSQFFFSMPICPDGRPDPAEA